MIIDLRQMARALGGEVVGGQVLCPGPRHSLRDRSLSVCLSSAVPHGFIAFSHAGDDWRDCRDHVRRLLGVDRHAWKGERRPSESRRHPPEPRQEDDDREKKMADALGLWTASVDPRVTLVETYLRSRGLELGDGLAGDVLRWHPGIGAMIALFRNIRTGEPQAISRTFLNREGKKLDRRFLGPVGGAAIMLDASEAVLGGLHTGEGVETCMAARQIGLRPVWALGSAGAIAAFPVLDGIEALTLLRERDVANARAADQVTFRWQAEGHEVFDAWPNSGKDVNDALKGGAA